jgi:hypothetical protein
MAPKYLLLTSASRGGEEHMAARGPYDGKRLPQTMISATKTKNRWRLRLVCTGSHVRESSLDRRSSEFGSPHKNLTFMMAASAPGRRNKQSIVIPRENGPTGPSAEGRKGNVRRMPVKDHIACSGGCLPPSCLSAIPRTGGLRPGKPVNSLIFVP